jgi:capsular polysaccharide biosynthesis protein
VLHKNDRGLITLLKIKHTKVKYIENQKERHATKEMYLQENERYVKFYQQIINSKRVEKQCNEVWRWGELIGY